MNTPNTAQDYRRQATEARAHAERFRAEGDHASARAMETAATDFEREADGIERRERREREAMTREEFRALCPVRVDGVTYHPTGKTGHRITDGVAGREYATNPDRSRLWVYADGSIAVD